MRLWAFTAVLLLGGSAAAAAAPPVYAVVDRIAGPDGGWDYARVDAAHDRVLVARGNAVMAVSLKDKTVTPALAKGVGLHIALPIRDGAELVLTNGGDDTAVFVDGATGAPLASVATGKGPDAAAYDARTGLVLVMDHRGGDVTLIDLASHKSVGRVEVGGALEEGVADGAGRAYINVEDRNELAVIDLAARKVVGRFKLTGCDAPTGIAYDARDKLVISACDGATVLVEAASGRIRQTLPTGKGADGVAWDPARGLAFVPAGRDGTLAVVAIRGGEGAVVQTVKTDKSARTIALDERTGRLYLPAADYVPAASAGGRPTRAPGTFRLVVVAPR